MSFFLGIDAGTSGVKAIVIDDTGKIRGTGYKECDIITPKPNWVEQNPLDWWDACKYAISKAVMESGRGKDIIGIGFSGQMQGCTIMDKNMNPVGNCIIWLDNRATAEVSEIEGLINVTETLGITTSHCMASYWAPKLLWLKKNRPEDFAKAHKVLYPKDYLRFMLTGEVAAEVSDSSFSFFVDVPNRKWSDKMFRYTGIDRALVPDRLIESQDIAGYLKTDLAEEFGMTAGIPVVAGGGDQPCGGVGNGIVWPGIVSVSIGTSGVVFACGDEPIVDKKKRGSFSLCHSVPGKWAYLSCTLAAGGSFKWLRDNFFADKKEALAKEGKDAYDYMTSLAALSKPAAKGLTYLPYLNGDATPIVDANARGTFFGLSYMHTMGDICRSVMEGVTYSLRDAIEILRELGLNISEVRASGGGAKSGLWRRIQADIYNASVVTMNIDEGPAAGAAILAAVGAGYFGNIEEACGVILKPVSTTDPIPGNAGMYNEFYGTYKQIYANLKDTFSVQALLVDKFSGSMME